MARLMGSCAILFGFATVVQGQFCYKWFSDGEWVTEGNCDNQAKHLKVIKADIAKRAKQEMIENCGQLELEMTKMGSRINGGIFNIAIPGIGETEVYCDVTTDGGGWIVFQRRMDGTADFFRDWNDYVKGFGDVSGEFWLGLEMIHQLTKETDQELRIDMTANKTGAHFYAKYNFVKVGPSSEKYRLTIGTFSGNTYDALAYHNNAPFSTRDSDNDDFEQNCANVHNGGWWYKQCHESNLNGLFDLSTVSGVSWLQAQGWEPMSFTEMKIRKMLKVGKAS